MQKKPKRILKNLSDWMLNVRERRLKYDSMILSLNERGTLTSLKETEKSRRKNKQTKFYILSLN